MEWGTKAPRCRHCERETVPKRRDQLAVWTKVRHCGLAPWEGRIQAQESPLSLTQVRRLTRFYTAVEGTFHCPLGAQKSGCAGGFRHDRFSIFIRRGEEFGKKTCALPAAAHPPGADRGELSQLSTDVRGPR